jgi:Tol biopolymer transport system component
MTILPDERIGTAVIAPDGTVQRVLEIPDDTLNAVCTVWSPDDSRLACEAWDDGDPTRSGIYTVRSSDGGDLQRLTTPPTGMGDLPGDYSPDGTQFVFKRTSEEAPGSLMLVGVAGGEPSPLGTSLVEDPGRFSPDGTTVLTSSEGRIVVMDLSGGVLQDFGEPGAYLFGPDWSPDGTWIAFSRATGGPVADVFISLPDGSQRQQVTTNPANEITIDWGPAT